MTTLQKATLVMTVSIFGYAIWIINSGYEEVASGLARVSMSGFMLLLLLSIVNYLLRFARWHWMLKEVTAVEVPVTKHLLFYIAGFALTATPGKVGEALRSFYLRPYGVKMSDSLAALVFERILDLLAILIIGAIALIKFDSYRWLGLVMLLGIVIAAVMFKAKIILRFILFIRTLSQNQKFTKACDHLIDLVESTSLFMSWKIWSVGLLSGVIAWGAEAWGFALLVHWLTGEQHSLIASGIYALAMLVGAVSFLPGGIGGAEVVMAGLLTALGLTLADATTATILCRAVTLWFAVILGLFVMVKLQLKTEAIKLQGNE